MPLGVFRSATAESAGQTFEVLAASTLTPSQIVFGKLQSAGDSMAAYLSAMASFLCFTYLLRGMGLPSIVIGLLVAATASLIVSPGAMAVGAVVKDSWWQPLGLLVVVGRAATVFIVAGMLAQEVATAPMESHLPDLCAGLACLGYFLTFFGVVAVAVSMTQFTTCRPSSREWQRRQPRRREGWRPVPRAPRRT